MRISSLVLTNIVFAVFLFPLPSQATLESTSEREHLKLLVEPMVQECVRELRELMGAEIREMKAEISVLRQLVEESRPFRAWLQMALVKRGLAVETCISELDLAEVEKTDLLRRFQQRPDEEMAVVSPKVRNAILSFLARHDQHIVFMENYKKMSNGATLDAIKPMLVAVAGSRSCPTEEIDRLALALEGKDITYVPSPSFAEVLRATFSMISSPGL